MSVTVNETGKGFQQEVLTGNHTFFADEPADVGGLDTGPTPYDLLLAALGTCTSMTLRMYADRKKWPVEKISVRLEHSKIHAKDCESCESEQGRVDRIERIITVEGDLDDDQRARLLEIANKCPVHRTIEGEKEITARWAD